jgi:hypothetical protein
MKTKFYVMMIVLITGIMLVQSAYSAGEWQNVMSKDGVDVYTRLSPGSAFHEFKGETVMAVPRDACVAVLKAVSKQTQWMPDTKTAKLIRTIDEKSDVLYHVTAMPWPLQDRDSVVRRDFLPESGTMIVNFRAIKDPQAPETKTNLRINEITGQWIFKAIDASHTRVTYSMRCNPGGNIPATVVNTMSKSLPYETLMGMKQMVKSNGDRK